MFEVGLGLEMDIFFLYAGDTECQMKMVRVTFIQYPVFNFRGLLGLGSFRRL